MKLKTSLTSKDERTTMPMLAKLMAIRSVANKRLGVFSKSEIILPEVVPESLNSVNCAGVIEKKAVSAAETNAEFKSKKTRTIQPIMNCKFIANSGFIIVKGICRVNGF